MNIYGGVLRFAFGVFFVNILLEFEVLYVFFNITLSIKYKKYFVNKLSFKRNKLFYKFLRLSKNCFKKYL